MPKITIYLYGLIPGKFVDTVYSLAEGSTLETVENLVLEQYGAEIPAQYKEDNQRLNHNLVIAGNDQGERLSYTSDISKTQEIWFIVPLAGG